MSSDEDFTIEWTEKNEKISDVRITKGAALYRPPWWRRVLLAVFGRTHWVRFKYHEDRRP